MQDFIYENRVYYSPIEFAMSYLGGTWKIPIILSLRDGALRYGDLKKAVPHITDKMLNTNIRDLERKKMVLRIIYREKPPRVEYLLTDRGRLALPAIDLLITYGRALMQEESEHIRPLGSE